MTRIEIEDYHGNTLFTFKIKGNLDAKDIFGFKFCNIADVDNDYYQKREGKLIRIQSEVE